MIPPGTNVTSAPICLSVQWIVFFFTANLLLKSFSPISSMFIFILLIYYDVEGGFSAHQLYACSQSNPQRPMSPLFPCSLFSLTYHQIHPAFLAINLCQGIIAHLHQPTRPMDFLVNSAIINRVAWCRSSRTTTLQR